jgi:hypothetical protein
MFCTSPEIDRMLAHSQEVFFDTAVLDEMLDELQLKRALVAGHATRHFVQVGDAPEAVVQGLNQFCGTVAGYIRANLNNVETNFLCLAQPEGGVVYVPMHRDIEIQLWDVLGTLALEDTADKLFDIASSEHLDIHQLSSVIKLIPTHASAITLYEALLRSLVDPSSRFTAIHTPYVEIQKNTVLHTGRHVRYQTRKQDRFGITIYGGQPPTLTLDRLHPDGWLQTIPITEDTGVEHR